MSDPNVDFLAGKSGVASTGASIRDAQVAGLIPIDLDIAPRNIEIPPPRVYPTGLGPFLRAAFLVNVYANAVDWSEVGGPPGKDRKSARRSCEFASKALLAKEPEKADAIFAGLEAVRDDQESRLSPVMWAWWRISSLMGMDGWEGGVPSILTVFNPEVITSPKMRAMFWKDGMSQVVERRVLWPLASRRITALWREFTSSVADSGEITAEGISVLWECAYQQRYDALVKERGREVFVIKDAIDKAVTRSDIGLWLVDDVVKHLRLSKVATTDLVAP